MEDVNEGASSSTNFVWQRPATPRETLFGLKTDGTIRSICSRIEIGSLVEIAQEVFEGCAEYFNWDMGCFNEFLMEREDTKEIWIVKAKRNRFLVEELEDYGGIDEMIISEEINSRLRPEEIPTWKLYYSYGGYEFSNVSDTHPHIYQLIFVFSTGTLDEFSCALICDLFLNILDCGLKDVQFQSYSHLNMYDKGRNVEIHIKAAIDSVKPRKRYKKFKNSGTPYKMFSGPCSNFDFDRRELKKKNKRYITRRCFISRKETQAFLKVCTEKDVGVYVVFIAIINNLLFHHAINNGFKGIFRTRVLNIINSRFIFSRFDKKYNYKLGCFSLPHMQKFKLESTEVEEIFKEALRIETELEKLTQQRLFWGQEALRELSIKTAGKKHKSGKCNPHYCFSLRNLGNLNCYYTPESPKNYVKLLSYDRAGSALEGGHLDVMFLTFNGELTVYFDFSNEYFNDDEMTSMLLTFNQVLKSIV